jgi:hypothetical protein
MRRCLLLLVWVVAGCQAAPPGWYTAVDATLARPEDANNWWDFADSEAADPSSREGALEILLKTEVFADVRVGGGLQESNQVKAFRRLLAEQEARRAFRELTRRGRPAGQLYGLCGLQLIEKRELDRQLPRYRGSNEHVVTHFGCVQERMPVRALVKSTDAHAVRLRRGETLTAWFEAHPGGGVLDIVGGGYPQRFAGPRDR